MCRTGMSPGKIKILFIFIFSLLIIDQAFSQKTKEQLRTEKLQAIQQLNEAQKILEETEVQKQITLGQLSALSNQITAGESLINSLNQEISLINGEMDELNGIIHSLESDLNHLKSEYGVMAYNTYKSGYGLRDLTFLFSSTSFSQLFLRKKYMEQYAGERKKQVLLIKKVRESLVIQEKTLETKRLERTGLLNEEISQNQNLGKLKVKQSQLIGALGKKQSDLKLELEERKKAIAQLDKLIADLVALEIKESSKGKSIDKVLLSGNMATLSKSFESNLNNLPWPVATGFISSHFGTHPHPVYKKLSVPNDGIDIQTNSNEVVKGVFNGTVKAIAFVPGDMKYVVLIQHGEYFTVYAKMKEVNVKKGQVVQTNEPLGIVNTNRDGVSELQFQVWKNNQKLNPENWIVKK
jgi:murein DD-endopeptidase MepM/ murein hydrolase activator NlpD